MTIALPAIATDTGLLTLSLRRAGVLAGDGAVQAITQHAPRDMIVSRIVRLRLAYDGLAAGAPASLILKTRQPTRQPSEWGRQEVAFYGGVAPCLPPLLVPRCFDAAWQDESRDWHLLLEDLGDTHRIATVWPLPPFDAECRAIVAALARFHAAWWDDPRLGVSVGRWMEREAAAQMRQRLEGQFASLADRLGDRLSEERRTLYARYFAAWPRLGTRYRSGRDLTVVHGDAHVWNFFLAKQDGGDSGGVRIFDWDTWRLGLATDDLAYMIATHWSAERRRRLERPLLDHWHEALLAGGVTGYDRHMLDEDYRRSVLGQLLTPVFQAAADIPPVIWWNHLDRIVAAVDDLGCRDLLD